MRYGLLTITIAAIVAFPGCGTTWVDLNNSKVSSERIGSAKDACQYYQKLDELRVREYTVKYLKIYAPTEEDEEEWEQVYENSERKILAEIDECMRKQGLVRAE